MRHPPQCVDSETLSGVSTQLASLLARSTIEDHEEVLKAANEALKKNKSDPQAQHVRAIALLKLDRYDDALKTFEDGGDQLKKEGQLGYAYALYKNGRLQEATDAAAAGNGTSGLKHVDAQARYKLETFQEARELYDSLAKAGSQDSDSDLRINLGAIDAQLAWSGRRDLVRVLKAEREDMEQFETAYNSACGYIARGELQQASTLLARAKSTS